MSFDDPINRPFVGLQWENHLFQVDNQGRKLAASRKIMGSPQSVALAVGSWRLRAIGVPLWLAAAGLQGDIDILLSRWRGPGRTNPKDTIYGAFELPRASKILFADQQDCLGFQLLRNSNCAEWTSEIAKS